MDERVHFVARPEGFEPPTLCLEGRRSIHLSYGRAVISILILKHFPSLLLVPSLIFSSDCTKTVPVCGHWTMAVPDSSAISFAWRLSFSRASLFICNFICEYFLKT
jgi:hypothetical protein